MLPSGAAESVEALPGTTPIDGGVGVLGSGVLNADRHNEASCHAYSTGPAFPVVARRTDPGTSWDAARSVSNTAQVREWILASLRSFGPMSDTDLHALHVLDDLAPPCSESSLRTRRSELVLAGLVRDTGERSLTLAGRACVRWAVRDG